MKVQIKQKQFQIMLVLTHECNLNCIYCYEHTREKRSLDKEKVKQIISHYLGSNKYEELVIEFFGGEPWLRKNDIIDICEWTWKQKWQPKYRFFTSTNGTLIHGTLQEWLHKHNQQISCGLSLDGLPIIHNTNRSNSFDRIDIPFFQRNWPNQPVKMTITPQGLNSLADSIIYIHTLGFQLAGTNFAEGIDWSNPKYLSIVYQQLARLTDWYIEHPDIHVAPILNMPIETCEFEKEHIPNKYCAVRGLLAYDTDGKTYPCNFITPMTFSKEQLNKIDLSDFYDDEKLIDQYCFNHCYFYSVCPNCYGANLLINNSLSERDKSMCNLVKLRAYFTSVLCANRILNKSKDLEEIDKDTIVLQIKAIEKIKKICERELNEFIHDFNSNNY